MPQELTGPRATAPSAAARPAGADAPTPIVALDVAGARDALALADSLPRAGFFKVGLQLFTAAGPDVVRELRARGRRVFLDLKLHDIPNTVARAVGSAAELGVELLTVHASGGRKMLEAAASVGGPSLLAVTVLTSLSPAELAESWGRPAGVDAGREAARLAGIARDAGLHGVVASVHEVAAIRAAAPALRILTPAIRLAGDAPGDQTRVATPARAAELGSDYIVLGRTVTAAADPAAALDRVLAEIGGVG
jgi:orotidine-5'-phosphate decarboxylase